jgi:hypothetical protein
MSVPNDLRSPERVLYVLRLPMRLTAEEVGALINMHVDGVNNLVGVGLLETLADKKKGKRMFDAAYIEDLRLNKRWLNKATAAEAIRVDVKTTAQAEREAAREAARNKERA